MTPELQEKIQYAVMTLLVSGDKRGCAKLLWPWMVQNQQTDRIWKALDDHPYLAIMGHASASKTFTCAAWFLLDWWSRSGETSLMLTSDTIDSMKRRVWSDMKMLLMKTSVPMHGLLIDSRRIIKHAPEDDKHAIAGIAAESDDAQSKVQGVHAKYVRVLIDEADNKLSQSIWGAISNLGSSGELRVVALANPVDRLTEFGMHVEPRDGWGSINPELDDEWDSRMGWHVLRLDGMKSPNIIAGNDVFPFLLTNNGVSKIREEKGENSREWWSYVRAWYPKEGLIQSVFSNEIIEKSHNKIVWYSDTTPIASCDPAFEGGDNCVVCLGRMGRLASDPRKTGIEVSQFITLKRKATDKPVSIDFGDQIVLILKNHMVIPENFAIDCTGNGLGMSDYIKHKLRASTMAINFGGSPTDMMITTEDTKKSSERFDRFVSELWYVGREWMRLGLIYISSFHRDLAIQLEGRLYSLHTKDKIRVETKQEMKERRLKSPDEADALMLLVHLARSRNKTATPGLATAQKRHDPLARFKAVQSKFKATYGVPDRNED